MVKFTYNDFFAYDEILNKTQINNINEEVSQSGTLFYLRKSVYAL